MEELKVKFLKAGIQEVSNKKPVYSKVKTIIWGCFEARTNGKRYIDEVNRKLPDSIELKKEVVVDLLRNHTYFDGVTCSLKSDLASTGEPAIQNMPEYFGTLKYIITTPVYNVLSLYPDGKVHAYRKKGDKIVLIDTKGWDMIVQ